MEKTKRTEHGERAISLLCKLIDCPSITPSSAGSMELVEKELQEAGFELERMDAGGVENLWATHGNGAPLFAFVGHLDVVPPGDLVGWDSDPFKATEREGRIYGRGATDMKGGVAAMVVAATRLAREKPGHAGTVAIALTTDEEGPATHGIKHVVEELENRNLGCNYALVCEQAATRNLATPCGLAGAAP